MAPELTNQSLERLNQDETLVIEKDVVARAPFRSMLAFAPEQLHPLYLSLA